MAALPPGQEHAHVILVENPPHSTLGILRRLGPGLIIAGSIVGSGELIGTTKTGADAGYWLLWLILIGCVIKVFVQVEFGRFAIGESRGTMQGLNMVPGPRWRVNWIIWYWVLMFGAVTAQLGGIAGGVGQSLALSVPLTGDFVRDLDQRDAHQAQRKQLTAELEQLHDLASATQDERARLTDQIAREVDQQLGTPTFTYTYDDVYWTAIVAIVTSVALVLGRYRLIQNVSTFLVAGFTALTIFNVFALPYFSNASISWSDIADGLKFRLPPMSSAGAESPLATALATFGIIGVGAIELIAYPYWCLEKGYGRFTGPRDQSDHWAARARGWMRVMRWDAWCSMVIYTLATVAFYLLGAAVLHPRGLSPQGSQMIRALGAMYEEVFNPWGDVVFLIGAFAVLYSTFFVATAGNARIAADALNVFRIFPSTHTFHDRAVTVFSGLFPIISFACYIVSKNPVKLVLFSGLTQSIMLPMLAIAALWFRYRRCDRRIAPGRLWDSFLWLSFLGLLVAGSWGAWQQISKLF